MPSNIHRYLCAGLASVLCVGLAADTAFAVAKHRTIQAKPGMLVRVSNHMHFKAGTCQAISIPKVIIRRKPAKGTLSITEGVLPLGGARAEQAAKCIGKPMRAAIVSYIPAAGASGDDALAYDVVFPRSCTNCRNFEVTAAISIGSDAPRPTSTPSSADGDEGSE